MKAPSLASLRQSRARAAPRRETDPAIGAGASGAMRAAARPRGRGAPATPSGLRPGGIDGAAGTERRRA